jgi:competence protein ComEA
MGRGRCDANTATHRRIAPAACKETTMNRIHPASLALALGLLLAAGAATAADRVDINSADAAAIDAALVNVGRAKAEAIVAYRKEHGAFKSAEQLAEVKGIGLSIVEKNRDRIALGGGAKAAPATPAAKAK